MDTAERKFATIALVGRTDKSGIAESLARLAAFLKARGHRLILDIDTGALPPLAGFEAVDTPELGRRADLAIVVGGDGTLLSLARKLAPFRVPLIGVNQGRLGFLTDVSLSDMESSLDSMLAGRYVEEDRTLLEATLERDAQGELQRTLALNDIVVNRGMMGGMIDCAVSIDARFVYSLRADGLIVATPTGSTAYALSAQGPIVDPAVSATLLVPVAPHALTNRPIAIRDSSVIEITLLRGKGASLHCDGQSHFELIEGDRVVVRRAEHCLRLLHPDGYDYFAMLRQKLHWSETPERLRAGGDD